MSLPSVTHPRDADREPRKRNSPLLLWAIVLMAVVLRLVALGRKSFWLDEIASVAISRRPSQVFWHFLWHDEGNMALYYVLLKPWLHLGYGEATVRLLSVLAGIVSVPVMYLLAKRLLGAGSAMLAAALLALSTCAISVSQEARAYSLVVLAVLLSTYLFVRLIERPSYFFALAYGLAAGLTCYFHYFGVLVPAAHAVSLIALPAERRPWKPLILAGAIITAMASPILWLIHTQDLVHISWVQRPSWLELYHLGVYLAADGGKAFGAVLLTLELVLAGAFLASIKTQWRVADDRPMRWRYALITSTVATPVLIALLVSIVRPVFYHRFLIICLPGWLLLIAGGMISIPSRAWRTRAIAAVCALSLTTTIILYRRLNEDWRSAVQYLVANTRPEDGVLYYQPVGEFGGESYRDWVQPPETPRPPGIRVDSGSEWRRQIDHAPRLWLVLYRAKQGDDEPRAIDSELGKNYVSDGTVSFRGITIIPYRPK
jgi:mannosyltransferase